MVPEAVRSWLDENGYGTVISIKSVGGGCINNGAVLKTASGRTFFLKTNSYTPPDMFEREAEELEALSIPGGPRVPKPYLFGADFILMEDLETGLRRQDYWTTFGRRLAVLHQHINDQFGFPHDNYIGSTPQPNPWTKDGYTFFAEHRLLFQVRLAIERGLLSQEDARRVEKIAVWLPDLVPCQPASLIHGDLWYGNVVADKNGEPAIIDPAANYGWAEAELAMTTLFGSFTENFYRVYQEVRLLEPGFRDRFPIYNLYHLLNHLNLFGKGYLGEVQQVLRKFG